MIIPHLSHKRVAFPIISYQHHWMMQHNYMKSLRLMKSNIKLYVKAGKPFCIRRVDIIHVLHEIHYINYIDIYIYRFLKPRFVLVSDIVGIRVTLLPRFVLVSNFVVIRVTLLPRFVLVSDIVVIRVRLLLHSFITVSFPTLAIPSSDLSIEKIAPS